MKRLKNFVTGALVIAFLMILGSLLHVPQWVAKAAAIYSSPVSNIIEAYGVPYQSGIASVPFSDCFVGCIRFDGGFLFWVKYGKNRRRRESSL